MIARASSAFLFLLPAAVLLSGCQKAPAPKPEEIRPVRVQVIGAAPLSRSIELAGEVRARYETRLAFRVGGKMTERLVEVGSVVRAGQPVARLDPRDLELALTAAKAQLASAEADRTLAASDLKRYRELREKNFISQAEFDRRQSTLDTAEARLESARAQMRQAANQATYAVLTADSGGVITAIEAEAGQVLAAGQTVARLSRVGTHAPDRAAAQAAGKAPGKAGAATARARSFGEFEVAVAVPESQRDAFEQAGTYAVELNALPGRRWKGRLRELSPAADPVTRTFTARISILEAGEDVELGMSARAIAQTMTADKRIRVPVAALYSKGDAPQVWLVDKAGAVRLQAVKTGGLAGDQVIIEGGLSEGDQVVVAGAQLLHAGQKVKVAAPAGAAAPAVPATSTTPAAAPAAKAN